MLPIRCTGYVCRTKNTHCKTVVLGLGTPPRGSIALPTGVRDRFGLGLGLQEVRLWPRVRVREPFGLCGFKNLAAEPQFGHTR